MRMSVRDLRLVWFSMHEERPESQKLNKAQTHTILRSCANDQTLQVHKHLLGLPSSSYMGIRFEIYMCVSVYVYSHNVQVECAVVTDDDRSRWVKNTCRFEYMQLRSRS